MPADHLIRGTLAPDSVAHDVTGESVTIGKKSIVLVPSHNRVLNSE